VSLRRRRNIKRFCRFDFYVVSFYEIIFIHLIEYLVLLVENMQLKLNPALKILIKGIANREQFNLKCWPYLKEIKKMQIRYNSYFG